MLNKTMIYAFPIVYCIYHDSENNWIEKARINLDKNTLII